MDDKLNRDKNGRPRDMEPIGPVVERVIRGIVWKAQAAGAPTPTFVTERYGGSQDDSSAER